MYNLNFKTYTYILISLLLIAPALVSTSNINAKKKPQWVKQRPSESEYYIGRAMTYKQGNIAYSSEARNKALKQLSSEIKVNISANSILQQFENNYQVKEKFEANTFESVEATLEGYEVYTWENQKEYWVMMKLSKDKYALQKRMKLDQAKKMSATYYYDGKKAVQNGNIYQGLLFYIKAIKAIKPHTSEDLSYKDIDGDLNLGTDIFSAIQNAFKAVNLQPKQQSYSIQFSKELKVPLTLNAYYTDALGNKKALSNLPLQFYFSKGEGELSPTGTTDRDGAITCEINHLISKRKSQEITAKFNTENLFSKEDEETRILLDAFFHEDFLPFTKFNIEVQKSSAYIEMEERVFGDSKASHTFGNMMRSELAQSFFNITQDKENADFIVRVNSEFIAGDEKKGKGYSLFIVFVEFHMSVTDNKNNMEIFADGFSGLKGMKPGSFEHALKDARVKAKEKIINEILPKMEKVNL